MKIHKTIGVCLAILVSSLVLLWAQEDRVGFPRDYEKSFKLYHVFNREERPQLREMWINPVGAQAESRKVFPYGTIIVMVTYDAKAQDGKPLQDDRGLYLKGKTNRVDVMRKEKGYGEAYGASRSGEWEFNAYGADGKLRPGDAARCAKCHIDASTTDFVFTAKELKK